MPNRRLDSKKIKQIQKLLKKDWAFDRIAAEVGCSAGTVHKIKHDRLAYESVEQALKPVKRPPSHDQQAEVAHLKSQLGTYQRSVQNLLKERGRQKAFFDELKSVVAAVEPLPTVKLPKSPKTGQTPIAAVIKLSDWQIGEVINPLETDHFGEFDFDIAVRRTAGLAQKVLDWVAMHRSAGYNIRELHVFSEADLVSGNIHYELEVTNEFPVTVAATKAGQLLADTIAKFAPHFDSVTCWEMSADNHGRLTRKNQAKQGALNNYSYIAHVICNEMLSKHKNIRCELSTSTKLLATVMGKRFLLSHGHHIMGQMGIPYYGMERDRARESVKRQNTDQGFDYISIGHWHVPAIISSNILVNGSLPGTTEFDHMQGRHAPPSQVSFMVHPEHGLFDWTAWNLSDM